MAGKAEYKNQWQKENCDRINLTVPKGRKDEIKAHAERRGESVNAFIKRAIDETIEREA
ncbi:MAG: ribbon-helix-helix protein, CopG family [Oscillospiraceae bacterium]|nr:ribbon-helix-helix protein, CopG family [Oscillospiraceae bacterium]